MDVVTLGMAKAAAKKTDDAIAARTALIPIAGRGNVYTSGLSNGTDTSTTYRTGHRAAHDITDVRLVFANFYNASGVETIGPNDVSVKFTIQAASDSYRLKGSFGGKRTVVIEPGTRAISDAIPIDIKAGELFYVYTYVSVASAGMKWPVGVNTTTVDGEGRIANTDYTDAGTVTVTSAVFAYSPVQILGAPPKANTVVVGGIGDSILAGTGDGNTIGYWQRGLTGKISEQRIAYPGEQAVSFGRRDLSQYRWPLLRGSTHIVCELGVNDIKGAQSAATVEQSLVKVWAKAAQRGAKVYQTTVTPVSTSTDAWATTANQSVTANEGARVALNDWIRAGGPVDPTTSAPVSIGTAGALVAGSAGHPLTGHIDLADTAESARNSGIWKAGYTSDGTHPNATGHTALAEVFTPALFT